MKTNKFWTKEKCLEEALKYKTKTEFQKKSGSAYNHSLKRKFINEICMHMVEKKKFNGYWTKEKCLEEALKYKTRTEFKKFSPSPFSKSEKNKWLDEICLHMKKKKKINGYWTKEKCLEEALKYKTKTEYQKNSTSSYISARLNNWLDEICKHMIIIGNKKFRCIYSYEFSDNYVYVGLTFSLNARQNSRNSDQNDPVTKHILLTKLTPIRKQLTNYLPIDVAIKLEGEILNKYKNENWNILNSIKTGGIGGYTLYWTKEKCIEAANKCKTTHEFIEKYCGAYYSSLKNKWINDVTLNLEKSKSGLKIKYTYEFCEKIALKYKSKEDLKHDNFNVYQAIVRNKWLNIICKHMINKYLNENN